MWKVSKELNANACRLVPNVNTLTQPRLTYKPGVGAINVSRFLMTNPASVTPPFQNKRYTVYCVHGVNTIDLMQARQGKLDSRRKNRVQVHKYLNPKRQQRSKILVTILK